MGETIEIRVEGMSCEGCVAAVTKAVAGAAPGAKIDVGLESGIVRIAEAAVARAAIESAIEKAGYDIVR